MQSQKADKKEVKRESKKEVMKKVEKEEDAKSAKSMEIDYFGNPVGSNLPLPEHYKGEDEYEAEFGKDEDEYNYDEFEEEKPGADAQIQKLKKDFEANDDE